MTDGLTGLFALGRLAASAPRGGPHAEESCDLCRAPVSPDHRHLLDVGTQTIACACQACALLFQHEAASRGKYRLIPDRRLFLSDVDVSESEWERLRIPVGLAFLRHRSVDRAFVVSYPSPLGATESVVEPGLWGELEARHPALRDIRPDLEALLVNRGRGARQLFVVPIDECYRLVGIIRTSWKGLSGGEAVWEELRRFFDDLRARSRHVVQFDERSAV